MLSETVSSSVCRVFSMMTRADKHFKHLNTHFRRSAVVVGMVEKAGVGRKESGSAHSGVQGVFPQVDGMNTANTYQRAPHMVFGGDAS